MPECTKLGFWKDTSSPACAMLYEEDDCHGDSAELFVGAGINGTARSATIRPGCYLYERNTYEDLGLNYGPSFYFFRKQYWSSSDNQSHVVSCRCFTNIAAALTCTPCEEWILVAAHDNRKYSVASLFEFKYTTDYLLGHNGKIMSPTRSQLRSRQFIDVQDTQTQQFNDVVSFHGLETSRAVEEGPYVKKIIVPAKSCAFVLQEAYKCDNFFYVRSKVEVRLQDSASTNGGTQPCNLDYASAVPADTHYG